VRCGGDAVDAAFEVSLQRSANAMGATLGNAVVQHIMANEWEPRIKRAFCASASTTMFPLKLHSHTQKSTRIHDRMRSHLKTQASTLRSTLESINPAYIAQVFANTISTIRDLIDDQIVKVQAQGQHVKVCGISVSPSYLP
jgi:hypothetical protein